MSCRPRHFVSCLLLVFIFGACRRHAPVAPLHTTPAPVHSAMETEHTYHGRRILVSTQSHGPTDWTSTSELLLEDGRKEQVPRSSPRHYASEEEAIQSALSDAAAAVDRSRVTRGKP